MVVGCKCAPMLSIGDYDPKMIGCHWCQMCAICCEIKGADMGFYDDEEVVELEYDECKFDTGEGGAKLLRMGDEEVWIPNSLIKGDDGKTVDVPRWFAEKEGLV